MRRIGIDIGTTTICGVVYDVESEEILESRTIANDSFIDTGYAWEKIQDVDRVIQRARGILDELIAQFPEVSGIGLTGQMHGILYLNEEGQCTSPLYTWQDQRGNLPVFGQESVVEHVQRNYGCKIAAGYGLATHIYQHECGKVPEGAVSFCTIADYLGMYLTGRNEAWLHASMAASVGLFRLGKNVFETEILREYGVLPEFLPRVTEDIQVLGYYKNYPVTTAIGDNQASFLGNVGTREDTILINVGTGSQISVLSEKIFPEENGLETRPFLDGKFLLVGSALCGGRAYAIVEKFFRAYVEEAGYAAEDQFEIMNRLAEKQLSSDVRMKVRTTFQGTRVSPSDYGKIWDITDENFTPEGLIQGVLHGMVSELHDYYKIISRNENTVYRRIVASGNGIRRNRVLQKYVEQEFGMSVQLAKCLEEAACGAARSTLWASVSAGRNQFFR